MPRVPRPVVPGQPMHITQRGNNRMAMFETPEDYGHFRETLRITSEHGRCAVHAYVFMTNHVHLLVTPDDAEGPARMMQALGRRYVSYFNHRYGRTGTLWEGRYRSTLIDSAHYLLTCAQYIELNPVRAGMVAHPDAHPWSSFRRNAYGEADALVTPHELYRTLGSCPSVCEAAYRAMFAGPLERAVRHARDAAQLAEVVKVADVTKGAMEAEVADDTRL